MTSSPSKVWFPVDASGEPDQRNPDDGFGGAVYQLKYTREFDAEKPVTSSVDDTLESWVGRPIKTIPEAAEKRAVSETAKLLKEAEKLRKAEEKKEKLRTKAAEAAAKKARKEAVKVARIEMQAPEFRKAARAGELALTLSHGGGPATAFMEDIAKNPECWFRSDPDLEEDHRDRLMESFRIFQEKLIETKNPTEFLQDLEEFVSRPTKEEAVERMNLTRKALFG